MAFEKYIHEDKGLFIVLATWHEVIKIGKKYFSSPARVELLSVAQEKKEDVKYVDFERWVSSGVLKRIN